MDQKGSPGIVGQVKSGFFDRQIARCLWLWYSQALMKRMVVLFLLLSLSGCSPRSSMTAPSKGRVLARFDGAQVTDQDFLNKVHALPAALQKVAMEHKVELIQDMASEYFLIKEAERQGLDKDPEVEAVIRAAQKKIVIAKLIDKEVDKKLSITPEDVSQYYQFHKEEFMTPLLMRASHILVKTEEEAREIKAELDNGKNFEDLARQRSIDASAAQGGDLGIFQKGRFVPEFEQQILGMKKGEIRGPVKTQFGYHILRLSERVESRLRDFQAVKNLAEEHLINERRSKAFKAYVEKLKGNVKIETDEKALKNLSLTGQ